MDTAQNFLYQTESMSRIDTMRLLDKQFGIKRSMTKLLMEYAKYEFPLMINPSLALYREGINRPTYRIAATF